MTRKELGGVPWLVAYTVYSLDWSSGGQKATSKESVVIGPPSLRMPDLDSILLARYPKQDDNRFGEWFGYVDSVRRLSGHAFDDR